SMNFVNGQWSGSITVGSWEFANVRLTAADPGGRMSQSGVFDVVPPTVSLLNIASHDLVYSELTHLLYASYTNTGTLTPIDPFTAVAGTPVSIGAFSGKLAVSDGGQYVFASLSSSNRICQFDVNSQSIVQSWNLAGMTVEDMTPVVGSPAAVAVSRRNGNGSPHFGGVVIYDNGVARSNSYTAFLGANVIEPSGTPGYLYGYDNESSPAATQILKYDAGGIYPAGSWGGLQGFNVDIACRAGLIFATTGQIFDPARNQQIGTFTGGLPVAEDVPSGRYYIISSGAVTAYDVKTLLPVGVTATGLSPAGTGCVRWGSNGIAFRTGSRVALVRTPLIASGLPADLVLSVANATGPMTAGSNFTYTLTVSNAGPNTARGLVIASTISPNAQFIAAIPSAGTAAQGAGGLICSLKSISSGATASVNVTLKPLKPGLLTSMVSVTSDSLDPDLTNNVALVNTPVSSAPAPDSVVELVLNTTDLVFAPHANRLFMSVPNSDRWLGNNVVSLNPASGVFDSPVGMGMDPGKLAVSDDGQFLYAGINSDATIQRMNLAARTNDLRFPTGYGAVVDMAALPGSPESVIATAWTTFAVYDHGVRRPNVVSPGAYNFEYYLSVSGTNTLAYETMPDGMRRIALDASGATVIGGLGAPYIFNFDRLIRYDSGLLYSGGGRIFNPEVPTMVATVPLSGLVVPDSQANKVFYLTTSGSSATLHAIQLGTYTEVGSVVITNVSGSVSSLVRWGKDGLAFRTSGGQVFLLRTTMADDRDNDGLADSWEQQYFPTFSSPGSAAGDDPDGDGMTNLQEWRAGLNPVVYDPVRFLSEQRLPGGGFQLTVLGRLAQSYALFASTNLSDWTPITNFTCTDLPTVLIDPAATSFKLRFYRLGPQSAISQPSLEFGAPPLAANGVNLVLKGFAGITYQLQTSTNLNDWFALTNFTSSSVLMPLRDPSATNDRCRFYRVTIP
ncbi:MAG: conserved repeat domain protein, partial [Pedosphaera sp.]|nr:conserved repeat domain protein [Pedosphaera sp.]